MLSLTERKKKKDLKRKEKGITKLKQGNSETNSFAAS